MTQLTATPETFWSSLRENLLEVIPADTFRVWFDNIRVGHMDDDGCELITPNEFSAIWIRDNYLDVIRQEADRLVGYPYTVELLGAYDDETEVSSSNRLSSSKKKSSSNQRTGPSLHGRSLGINPKNTFSNFVVGAGSELAHAACVAVSNAPAHAYNPLFLYGDTGLGKTHLLHAIGNYVLETDPLKNVILVTSEKFTLDFVNSLRKNNTAEFTRLYRSADILLIDDVQFFRGKEQTQEQFFHTFNELYQSGRQIVMTSDVLPSEMKGLQDRLVSRFQSGLSVDIQPPNYEIRIAILLEKSEQNGINLEYGYLEFIARHIKSNIRDLEGTIIRILAKSSLMNKEIDFDLIKEVVKERVGSSFLSELSIESVVKKASELTRVKEKDLVGKSRKAEIALARQLSMYLCRDVLGASLNKIGLFFGGRDHSTVIHALKVVEDKKQRDDNFCKKVEFIKKSFETLA